MVKREARADMTAQKNLMISSLYANSLFDESEENVKARTERIKSIEKHFNRAITLVYDPHAFDHETAEIDWDNPFWQAARRSIERNKALVAGEPTATVERMVDEEAAGNIDQL